MTLFTELIERVGIEGDAEATAAAIITDLKLTARQREALSPLILEACSLTERNRVRNVEKAARPGRKLDPTGERQALLGETFTLGNGERIPWGEATIEQHQARADYLATMRDGISATITRHLEAIELIRSAGVSCLNELKALAA